MWITVQLRSYCAAIWTRAEPRRNSWRLQFVRSGSSYGKSFDTLFGGGSRAGGARIDQTIASQPIARLGNAEDIAAAVCWLAGLEASCITGTDLLADGGMQASLRWSK